MSGIISLFTWAFVVSLVLAGIVGAVIRELVLLILRPGRERRQETRMAALIEKSLEADWQKRHPGEAITDPVRVQLAGNSAAVSHAFVASGGFRVGGGGVATSAKNTGPGAGGGGGQPSARSTEGQR
jgi:hypothetical protein